MVTIARRKLLTALAGTAAWPLAAIAQQPKVWRIGVLAQVPPTPAMLSAFRDGMRGRGYVEGQDLSIDVRWPQGSFDQDPSVVTELVNSNVVRDPPAVWQASEAPVREPRCARPLAAARSPRAAMLPCQQGRSAISIVQW